MQPEMNITYHEEQTSEAPVGEVQVEQVFALLLFWPSIETEDDINVTVNPNTGGMSRDT